MTTTGDGSAGLADPTDQRSNCGIGVVLDLETGGTHDVVVDALTLLERLEHRGTTGAEKNTGDGAGIVLQRPDELFSAVLDDPLPDVYAVGSLFLPTDPDDRATLKQRVEQVLKAHDLRVFAWRSVPTGDADLGDTARTAEPAIEQCFVAPGDALLSADDTPDLDAFDRALYVGRNAVTDAVDASDAPGADRFYVCSLDRQTVVYKGLLKGTQLADYFPDLTDPRVESAFAMVHARFSTNTLGAWELAHPFRRIVHNGEFNTIQGNINWMRARETELDAPSFSEAELEQIKPVIDDPDQSDTASVDNALELLMQTGRELPHALRMLVPEAWRNNEQLSSARRDWYDYHASLVEPWDGPALVCATDGERVGAVLDRNGLRPCRYDRTTDGRLLLASEAGVLDTDPALIETRGRLEPGQLFLADPEAGEVISDEQVFTELTDDRYGEWTSEQQVQMEALTGAVGTCNDHVVPDDLRNRQAVFGYNEDEIEQLLTPMLEDGKDPIGSMGDDTPLSVLSEYDRPLFSYFKQLFAQVTNPPIDYIREEVVTSLESRLGHQRNLCTESPAHARQLVVDSPVLSETDMAAITGLPAPTADAADTAPLTSSVIDATFDPDGSLEAAVEQLCADAAAAIHAGADVVVLSDHAVGPDRAPIPSLLATGAVHHHLVREGLRTRAGLAVNSGDPRTVHHLATLIGYGAGAVCPTLAYDTVRDLVAGDDGAPADAAIGAYVDALEDGLLKTMAKMGISTVESYQGAQIFEAVGLADEFVEAYFAGTKCRTGGIGIDELAETVRDRHELAWTSAPELERTGEFEHRSDGISHAWNPESVSALHTAVRSGDESEYEAFADSINGDPDTLRRLLTFDTEARESIPIEAVEPAEEIVKRFSTAAMSLGSLSPEAHENNAVAMNRLGAKANTGEGGEPPERFGTERECSVKQVASGRFGVTASYLNAADELQIKMAQGSKPGEGGHLPGSKVNEMIADVRYATPGVGLISPPPLHDIYSIEDLKQLIYDLKAANPAADVNVKLVSEDGIGTIAAGVAKANADVIHISGHSGGTGASPRTSIKHAGLPWELGLAEANQLLVETDLRDRVRLSVDGGLKTGRDVAVAALLGAEEFVFGTASLVSSGCVMARQCHQNTCPVGVATQNEDLRGRFPGEPRHVANYMMFIAEELRGYMAELGVQTVDELIGRVELLEQRQDVSLPTAGGIDLSPVLAAPDGDQRRNTRDQEHALAERLDQELIEAAAPAIDHGDPATVETTVSNVDRAVGTTLSHEIVDAHGPSGLPDGTLTVRLRGTAGQSFGAFLAAGVSMHLTGAANDYVGKGLSGGRIVVSTPQSAGYDPASNVVIGNVALYGATAGECYVNGVAGERFAVRNSGVRAVVEGVGDHGCEYMTGGVVAVLGDTGRNFAAGMSGGVAYVYDPDETVETRTNQEMVSVNRTLSARDRAMLRRLIENHHAYTGSDRAAELLAAWDTAVESFVTVMPDAYSKVLEERDVSDVRTALPAPATSGATDVSWPAAGDD